MDYKTLRQLFKQSANPEIAAGMTAYLRNQFPHFGIPTPRRREITKKFFANEKKTDPIDWAFVFECYRADERELQYAAVNYLERNAAKLTKDDIPNLKQLIETRSWWDTVDSLDAMVGGIAFKDPSVNAILLAWSKDENFWLRRVAIDHQLRRKDKTNTELLATIIKNNLNQKEFFINKAIGWALREYSKTDPEWVRNFIDENKKNMANLSIREAGKYI